MKAKRAGQVMTLMMTMMIRHGLLVLTVCLLCEFRSFGMPPHQKFSNVLTGLGYY